MSLRVHSAISDLLVLMRLFVLLFHPLTRSPLPFPPFPFGGRHSITSLIQLCLYLLHHRNTLFFLWQKKWSSSQKCYGATKRPAGKCFSFFWRCEECHITRHFNLKNRQSILRTMWRFWKNWIPEYQNVTTSIMILYPAKNARPLVPQNCNTVVTTQLFLFLRAKAPMMLFKRPWQAVWKSIPLRPSSNGVLRILSSPVLVQAVQFLWKRL